MDYSLLLDVWIYIYALETRDFLLQGANKKNILGKLDIILSTVLCCIVLQCTVLYCILLYCTVLYCTKLYCIVFYCILLYCTVLYCTILYCIVLYCIVLYYTEMQCIFVPMVTPCKGLHINELQTSLIRYNKILYIAVLCTV